MKKAFLVFTIAFTCLLHSAFSQDLTFGPTYMSAVSSAHAEMNKKHIEYMSKTAHGASIRKQESLRQAVLESIVGVRTFTYNLPPYNGDNDLRQASLDYIDMCYAVFFVDYVNILNMEDKAGQSVDDMRAYISLQDKAKEKLSVAAKRLETVTTIFAAKHDIRLKNDKGKGAKKMETAGNVNNYTNEVYLIFFKCNKQDNLLVKAIESKKIYDIEQTRSLLIAYADEGLLLLESTRPYGNDFSLVNACKAALTSYKTMAEKQVPGFIDFLKKLESFEFTKSVYEAKSKPTRANAENYNKAIAELNDASESGNMALVACNTTRQLVYNNWSAAYKRFVDMYMPK